MKKIKVKTYLEKDKPMFTKRFYFILIGIGLALLMVGSILQFGSGDKEDAVSNGVVKYGDYTFNNVNGKWILDFNGEPVSFDYLPSDLSGLYTENLLFGNKVYIAVDPKDNINNYFIQRIKAILQYKGILAVNACIKDEGCGDIPIVGCNEGKDVIFIKKGIEGKIYKDGSCLVFEGDNEGLIKGIDLLYYKLLGVL